MSSYRTLRPKAINSRGVISNVLTNTPFINNKRNVHFAIELEELNSPEWVNDEADDAVEM